LKVVVNCRFLTQPITGVQQYALKFSLHLKEHLGSLVEFVSPTGIVHPTLAEKLGVQTIGNTRGFFWEQVELPFWLKKQGSPLLVNFGNVAPQYYSNQLVTIHDLSTLEHPEWFSQKFARAYKFMIPQVIQHSKMVIAVSNFTKQRMVELLKVDPQKIEVIYNCVDTPEPTPPVTPSPYFLAIGSFTGRKNFTTLLQAFQQAAIPGYTLRIRGDQEDIFKEEKALQQQVSGQGNLYFIEPLNYQAYLDLVKNATALINTSVYEGFGMPNLEALMLGVPVICSDIEVFREVCGPCAQYTDPLNADQLAALMHNLVRLGSTEAERNQRIHRSKMFNTTVEGKKLVDLVLRNI
jgi:glycosyltransferase involved in cell wall biosynthesis